jgi:NTP pyrophosphatase (non-canonical NTP hydrolase)
VYAGLVEEVGEMFRAVTKRAQGIRGTREEWTEEIHGEIGDIFVKLCDVVDWEGMDLQKILETSIDKLNKRNWVDNRQGHGIKGTT